MNRAFFVARAIRNRRVHLLLDPLLLLRADLVALEHCHSPRCVSQRAYAVGEGRGDGRTESELFKRAARGLGEEEPDEDDFEKEEDAVADVVLPA